MKRFLITAALVILVKGVTASAAEHPVNQSSVALGSRQLFTGQVVTGYYGGPGLHVNGTLGNFAQGFPFSVRLGLGYARVPTGDALMARRVFINNATNGTPRSRGKIWDARLDVVYPVKLMSLKHSSVFGGARRAYYTADFEYIGGAETFNVSSNQWGIGGGIETAFPLSPRLDMIVLAGADYYFRATMDGHDTYYSPDGKHDLHPIDDYNYKDADKAIAQPEVETRVMFGIAYRF